VPAQQPPWWCREAREDRVYHELLMRDGERVTLCPVDENVGRGARVDLENDYLGELEDLLLGEEVGDGPHELSDRDGHELKLVLREHACPHAPEEVCAHPRGVFVAGGNVAITCPDHVEASVGAQHPLRPAHVVIGRVLTHRAHHAGAWRVHHNAAPRLHGDSLSAVDLHERGCAVRHRPVVRLP
jgi:hypothetical protein